MEIRKSEWEQPFVFNERPYYEDCSVLYPQRRRNKKEGAHYATLSRHPSRCESRTIKKVYSSCKTTIYVAAEYSSDEITLSTSVNILNFPSRVEYSAVMSGVRKCFGIGNSSSTMCSVGWYLSVASSSPNIIRAEANLNLSFDAPAKRPTEKGLFLV